MSDKERIAELEQALKEIHDEADHIENCDVDDDHELVLVATQDAQTIKKIAKKALDKSK